MVEQQGGLPAPVVVLVWAFTSPVCTPAMNDTITESVGLGKSSKIIQSKSSPSPPCWLTMFLSATCIQLLNISRESDYTTFLGNLCQCLTVLPEAPLLLEVILLELWLSPWVMVLWEGCEFEVWLQGMTALSERERYLRKGLEDAVALMLPSDRCSRKRKLWLAINFHFLLMLNVTLR